MQADLITQPETNSTKPTWTPPPLPQWINCSIARLNEMWDSGETNRQEFLHDLTLAKALNDPAEKNYIIAEYRKLTASYHLRGSSGAPGSYIFKQFAQDCQDDNLTFAQVIYGFKMSRRRKTGFAPTYGEFLDLIQKGEKERDGPAAMIHRYELAVRGMVDPKFEAKPQPWKNKIQREERLPLREQYAESRDLLDRMKSEKSQGFYLKQNGERRPWCSICETMMRGVAGRVEMLEEKAGRRAA